MTKWTALPWLKILAILLLLFLNCWIALKLFPYVGHALGYLLKVLAPFLIAVFIAYLLHPLVEGLHRQGIARLPAIAIIYILFFGTVIYAGIKGTPIFIKELKSFAKQAPELSEMYRDHVNRFYYATSDWPETVHDHFDRLVASLEAGLNRIVRKIVETIQWLFRSAFTILLIPFIVFYLLKDYERIKAWLVRLTPQRWREPARALIRDVDLSLGSYIRGQLLVCCVLGGVAAVGLWLLGIPYAILLGSFIGITDIIPYFGPLLGAVPAVFIAVTVSVKQAIFVVLLIAVLQFLEGNVISPLIVGKSVHIHPIVIMLSLVIGGDVAGVVGMLLSVPVFVTLRVFVRHFWHYYKKKIDNREPSHL
ncbi:AI-2E family transporter [Caenibacillus caldisaponilyticus]|uniref:AI-2E family transporter n=1 Tax=Caenibacillus caldisaponilyticus TaxID=1674942 RepID=UPI0009886674|nr:AI-2E family transporter [Caenibacillus caldisaponilyticus]